jgi:hypothetical protein
MRRSCDSDLSSGTEVIRVLRRKRISTSRGKAWERRHSLWILWTFALGFFSWLAFAYIGIRARHPRWLLWAVLYASPLIFFAVVSVGVSQAWSDATLNFNVLLGIVSIVHAFLIRKEYLLRLDLIKRERSGVSLTSFGRGWELRHSLWMAWTFTFGIFSWIAFFYIALRARRARWLAWGLVYFAIFVAAVVTSGSQAMQFLFGLMVVAGTASAVHAFAIREDYLVRLERRLHEAHEEDARLRRNGEAQYDRRAATPPPVATTQQQAPSGSSGTATAGGAKASLETPPEAPAGGTSETLDGESSEPTEAPDEDATEVAPSASPKAPAAASAREKRVGAGGPGPVEPPPAPIRIADTYPLPIAYSWSLLRGIWDPRDRYREQLRHAENILAFLGSVSLSILDEADYGRAQLDLKVPWQGGISFGAWKLIAQRSAKVFRSYEDHPLATSLSRLNVGSETKGFGADMATLIRARNDFHHGRGPTMEEDVAAASNEAQERLQRCMDALSFFTRYPIRLVQDFDVDRRNDDFVLKCLRLEGDGPGFQQEKLHFSKALPRGDLVMDLGNGNWVQLYPFMVASNCPHCRYRETYFVDRWNDRKGTVVLKSFERGHTEEKQDISDTLAGIVGRHQPVA